MNNKIKYIGVIGGNGSVGGLIVIGQAREFLRQYLLQKEQNIAI